VSLVVSFDSYHKRRLVPPLVFVELHNDQIAERPGFGAKQIGPVLRNCGLLLEKARSRGWPVAFFTPLQLRREIRRRPRALWIEGFEPRRNDMVFERTDVSCYTSREFADAMTASGSVFVMAGFSGEGACLATLIDAARHGHQAGLIRDASATRPLPGLSADDSHSAVAAIVSRYATIVTAMDWVQATAVNRPELEAQNDLASP